MAAKQNASILGEAKPSKAIINLALPATLALLAKTVYNIVDTAYIGMLKDDIALTAVGVTVPLLLIMVSIENIFAAEPPCRLGGSLEPKMRTEPAAPLPSSPGQRQQLMIAQSPPEAGPSRPFCYGSFLCDEAVRAPPLHR